MAWDDIKQDDMVVEPDEWNDLVANLKDRLGLVFNVQSDNASPDGGTATTGSITAATDDLVVASASTFAVGQGIVVVGAKLDTTDTGNTEDTDNDFTSTGGAADNEWMARKFTATNSGAVGSVANIRLKKTGAPAGTAVFMIYSDSAGPSAQIGGDSVAITNTDLNASGAEESTTWATDWPVIATGVDYWLVMKTVGYTYADGVTEVIWETDADGATGLNECYKYDSDGAPWTSMGANVGANITVNLNLSTTITAVAGTAITLAADATTTVSGAVVRHDEVTAIAAAHTSATASGGWVFFPAGVYNVGADLSFNSDAPLWFDPAATLSINSGVTVTFLNMIPPTHTVFSGSGSMTLGVQAITAAGDTILADAETVVLDPDGDYTMTSTPTIADGTPGQIVRLIAGNAEANIITLQDQDTLASSNLQLLAPTRTISAKTIMVLEFDGIDWTEQGSVVYEAITLDFLELSETTTPGADADYGKVYTKNDNRMYFQDGAGVERLVVLADYAGIYASDNAVATTILLVDAFEPITVFTADMPELISNAVHGTDSITVGTTGVYSIILDASAFSAGVNKVYAMFAFEIAASGSTITDVTQANPGVVTAVAHGFSDGERVKITGVVGMTELNGQIYTVANKGNDTFELNDDNSGDINTGGYGAYGSAGTAYLATRLDQVHILRKFAVATDVGAMASGGLASFTAGNTVEVFVKGLTDATNITFSSIQLSIQGV